MLKSNITLLILFIWSIVLVGQDRNILEGATEFRNILLKEYSGNLIQIEKLRRRLDSLGLGQEEFYEFRENLSYVRKRANHENSNAASQPLEVLLNNRVFNYLTEAEIELCIQNLALLYIPTNGIWEDRFPHKLKPNSLRFKRIAEYGIQNGDRIMHFEAPNSHLCEILFLSYDSLELIHYPIDFQEGCEHIFETVVKSKSAPAEALVYHLDSPPSVYSTRLVDKVIYDALPLLQDEKKKYFKKRIELIHKYLKEDGVLIIGANFDSISIDESIPNFRTLDKSIKKIVAHGFVFKERIIASGEYVVYTFWRGNK